VKVNRLVINIRLSVSDGWKARNRSQRRSMGGADSMGAVGVVFEDLFEDLFEVVDDQQQRLVPGPGLRAVPRSVVRRQTSHSPAALLPEALAFHLGRIRPRHIQDGTATHYWGMGFKTQTEVLTG
jgi:hypothetical protein